MLALALLLGWWVGRKIEDGVVQRSASTTALFVYANLENPLQELQQRNNLSEKTRNQFRFLLNKTDFGQHVVLLKVWAKDGLLLYSSSEGQIGQRYPVSHELQLAWQKGVVSSEISNLTKAENVLEQKKFDQLLEMYVPVRDDSGSGKTLAVVEFYTPVDELVRDIRNAGNQSWLLVGLGTLVSYLLLNGLVRRGNETILAQQADLNEKIRALDSSLIENQHLTERVRLAATRTTALNERFLHRISAELHDGPAQDLSFAALRLDGLREQTRTDCSETQLRIDTEMQKIETSVGNAVREVRMIAAGLRLPGLENLSLEETTMRAVRDHMRRTESQVQTHIEPVLVRASLPIKITVFRVIQEALSNSFRHGGGAGQHVSLQPNGLWLRLEIKDNGPGFNWSGGGQENHLGLLGMRERVESLGGRFSLDSTGTQESGTQKLSTQKIGTTVRADIPLYLSNDLEGEKDE